MSIDTQYIPAFTIEEVILDKDTGLPLSGGVVRFFRDEQRTVPKDVWQLTGAALTYSFVSLGAVLTLNNAGSFDDGLGNPIVPYFLPYDTEGNEDRYYVTVESAGGVAQFVRQSVPYIPDGSIPPEQRTNTENELSNQQFVSVLFNNSAAHTYAVTGTNTITYVAPGWEIISSGTGNIIVEQVAVTSTSALSNPPYALRISADATLGASIILRQRLEHSPRLMASGYVSGYLVASATSDTVLTMQYVPSNAGATTHTVLTGTITGDSTFHALTGVVQIGPTLNTDTAVSGYVDIQIIVPTAKNVQISSLQIVGVSTAENIPFDQLTQARQVDHLFHYYKPQIDFKPIPSILTGWDFPVNPAQIHGPSVSVTGTAGYAWDQTIMVRATANVTVVRSAVTGGIQATMGGANDAFYMLQYLTGVQAKKILGTKLSVNVNAFKGAVGASATVRVYLFRGSSAATFPTLPTTIGTLAATGVFTLTAANWTEIGRTNQGVATSALKTVTANSDMNSGCDYGFSGWEITDSTQLGDTDKFAIVTTFSAPTNATVITCNSISVVPGDIPTRPAPQTFEQVLAECRYYYEKSYDLATATGTATQVGERTEFMDLEGTLFDTLYLQSFLVEYARKRTNPTMTFWSPTGPSNVVSIGVNRNNTFPAPAAGTNPTTANIAGNFVEVGKSPDRVTMRCANTSTLQMTISAASAGDEGLLRYHFQADARLGVV